MSIVTTNAMDFSTISDMIASGGVLDSVSMGLFTNNVALSNSTVLGNLVEASFDGYLRDNLTWDNVFQGQSGAYHVNSQLCQFTSTDSTNPQTCYGYFVVSGTGSTAQLLFAELFAEPIVFGSQYNSVLISAQFTVGGVDNGDATVIS